MTRSAEQNQHFLVSLPLQECIFRWHC